MEIRFSNRIILALFTGFMFFAASAQQIEVGQWVKLGECKTGKTFESMDIYTKTRFPDKGIPIDTITGDGVFERFFAPGDFDGKRLPCDYGNKEYRVAALRTFEVEGVEKRVMILSTDDELTMIWVEFDKAIALSEIIVD